MTSLGGHPITSPLQNFPNSREKTAKPIQKLAGLTLAQLLSSQPRCFPIFSLLPLVFGRATLFVGKDSTVSTGGTIKDLVGEGGGFEEREDLSCMLNVFLQHP